MVPEEWRTFHHLDKGKIAFISIYPKANCIDSTNDAEVVFENEINKLKEMEMTPEEYLTLEPYERDHAVVVGSYRPKK